MRLTCLMVIFVTFFCATVFADPGIYTEDKLAITVSADKPEFIIKLKSNPTTGYSWFLKRYNARLLKPLKHSFERPNTKLIGAPGYEIWLFRVKPAGFVVPQQTALYFIYKRAWESSAQEKPLIFKITTQAG